jgi:hypothetical protein
MKRLVNVKLHDINSFQQIEEVRKLGVDALGAGSRRFESARPDQ